MPANLQSPSVIPLREQREGVRGLCIHQIFEAQAAGAPNAVALEFEGASLTYQQLNLHSSLFAARLRSLGVRPGKCVALYAPRSLETITSLLGILKAGGAYVALDMESPPDRLALMLADVEPRVILTFRAFAGLLPAHHATVLFLDEEFDFHDRTPSPAMSVMPDAAASPDDLAYVAFTSGSSGAPKGVCIPHRGVVRLAKADDYVSIANDDVFLQLAPLSFDASTFEIWCCLLNGAKLVIFPARKPSLSDLGGFIEREGITILWLTAGLFHRMAEGHLHQLSRVRQLFTGGDVVSVPHAEKTLRTLKECRLVNGYGPTENTTFSCCHPILEIPASGHSIPIGRPVAGTECHVLDEMLRPVAEGTAGELYLGGDGLASGYLRKPALTARKFIPHPFSDEPGARLYRTGDRVRFLPDGNLEFLGRVDRQVKILGHRVELVEIEAVLRRHPAVGDVCVVAQLAIAGGEKLVAAVAFRPGMEAAPAELRSFARRSLPPVMVPADFVFIDELPLGANGKIDQEAILACCTTRAGGPRAPAKDHTSTEAALLKIWRQVFGRQNLTTTDEFFEAGGNSLQAAHLLARIQTEFRKSVSMDSLLTHATIERLALLLDAMEPAPVAPVCQMRKGGDRPGLFCMPDHSGGMFSYNATAPHYSGNRTVYGLQSPGLLGLDEGTTVEEIAATHVKTIRALQPSGPYHLFGYCFGGLLAFEAARQLHAEGHTVGVVAVLHLNLHELPFAPFQFRGGASRLRFVQNLLMLPAEFLRLDRREKRMALQRIFYRALNAAFRSQPPIAMPATMTVERRLFEMHYGAWHRYVPRAFPGVVTLLRPGRLPMFQPDPKFGWGSVKGQRLEVGIVPGPGISGQALRAENAAGTARLVDEAICEWERRAMANGENSGLISS